jgi:hypothetical protein
MCPAAGTRTRIETAFRHDHRGHQRRIEVVSCGDGVDQTRVRDIVDRPGDGGVACEAGESGPDVDRREIDDREYE